MRPKRAIPAREVDHEGGPKVSRSDRPPRVPQSGRCRWSRSLNYGPEALLVAVTPPGVRVDEGASLSFDFDGGRLYLFDGEGRRLA